MALSYHQISPTIVAELSSRRDPSRGGLRIKFQTNAADFLIAMHKHRLHGGVPLSHIAFTKSRGTV